MKHIRFAFACCWMAFSLAWAQQTPFAGTIKYSNTYSSKVPQMTDQQWASMLGSTQTYFIQGGNYKSTFNGSMVQWQMYLCKDKKIYTKMSNMQAVYWNDGSVQGDEVLRVDINKNVTQVLGYPCDELILTCKSGVQKYYYNAAFGVDLALFSKHAFGNWYAFISQSKALSLKSVIETAQFTVVTVATSIQSGALDAAIFELPEGSPLVKSPY